MDYFGTPEEVAVWSVSDEKLPIVDKKTLVLTPVNETIKEIILIQENQRVFDDAGQTYDVWLTRGIVFDLGERQLAFEKDVWFSEEIIVHSGYEFSTRFSSTDRFGLAWEKSIKTECSRIEEKIMPE